MSNLATQWSSPESCGGEIRIALLSVPIVWWRKPYGGLDGHGASPRGRCEGSPESSEVSSLGNGACFCNHQLEHSEIIRGFLTSLSSCYTLKSSISKLSLVLGTKSGRIQKQDDRER
jgi:hypothetical protein